MVAIEDRAPALVAEFIAEFGQLDIGDTDPKEVAVVRAKAAAVCEQFQKNKEHFATLKTAAEKRAFKAKHLCSTGSQVLRLMTLMRAQLQVAGYRWWPSVGPKEKYEESIKNSKQALQQKRAQPKKEIDDEALVPQYIAILQRPDPALGELTNAILGTVAMRIAELANFDNSTNSVTVTESGKLRFCLKKTKDIVWHERTPLADPELLLHNIELFRCMVLAIPRKKQPKGSARKKKGQVCELGPKYTKEQLCTSETTHTNMCNEVRKEAKQNMKELNLPVNGLHDHRRVFAAIMKKREGWEDIDLLEEVGNLLGHRPRHCAAEHYVAQHVCVSGVEQDDELWIQQQKQKDREELKKITARLYIAELDDMPAAKRRRLMTEV